jgi:hypothetical protein
MRDPVSRLEAGGTAIREAADAAVMLWRDDPSCCDDCDVSDRITASKQNP